MWVKTSEFLCIFADMEKNDNNEVYVVSARKYRPKTFSTVVGQQALTHTLKSAIENGRLAHAYLFCGPRGVGKTSCARIFAKTINCSSPTPDGEACGKCESCQAFDEQRSLNIIELDAASNNGVDDIRALTDQVRIPPQLGKYRAFIIDEVHMLSAQAFNAFLKTLEEPPEHAIFILATTEKHKILPTILSRCQIYDFARITVQDIVDQLKAIAQDQGVTAEDSALGVIAHKADGAMRDALSIFDQIAAASQGNITYKSTIANLNVLDHDYYFRLVEAFQKVDIPKALLIYQDVRNHGFDSRFFVAGLANHLRNLMVASNPATCVLLETSDDVAKQYAAQAATIHPKWFYRAMDLCNTCDCGYPEATNKQFLVELTLIKLCQILDPNPNPPGGAVSGGTQPLRPFKNSAAQSAPNPDQASPASASQPARATTEPAPAPKAESAKPAPVHGIKAAPLPPPPDIKVGVRPAQRPASATATQFKEPEPTPTVVAEPVVEVEADRPFDEEMAESAWQEFIDTNEQQRLLTSIMSLCKPKRKDDTNYTVVVSSSNEATLLTENMAKLLAFIRAKLHNKQFAINIEINQTARTKFKSRRDIANNIVKTYPAIEKLRKEFGLVLD